MIKNTALSLGLAFSLALVGCETNSGQKEVVGTVLGAAGGGLLGSQFGKGDGKLATTAIGVVGGLLLGSSIGRSLDTVDKQKQHQAATKALETAPTGTSVGWQNPDSGNSGSMTPKRTYQRTDGTYCREYTQTVLIGGKSQQAFGTACRQPDGTWKLAAE